MYDVLLESSSSLRRHIYIIFIRAYFNTICHWTVMYLKIDIEFHQDCPAPYSSVPALPQVTGTFPTSFASSLLIRQHRLRLWITAPGASIIPRLIDAVLFASVRGNCFILSTLFPLKLSSVKCWISVLLATGEQPEAVAKGPRWKGIHLCLKEFSPFGETSLSRGSFCSVLLALINWCFFIVCSFSASTISFQYIRAIKL